MSSKLLKFNILAAIVIFTAVAASAQKPKTPSLPTADAAAAIRGTAAFAEILLRKAETVAELDALAADYTDDFPRIKELRFMAGLINDDLTRLSNIKPEDVGKLTLALGKLMIRRLDAAVELWKLRQLYADNHPDVRRAVRKWEVFDKAVNEILGPAR